MPSTNLLPNGSSPLNPNATPMRLAVQPVQPLQHVQRSDGPRQNGSASSSSSSLWARVENVSQQDRERQQLLQEIMTRYDYLTEQYQKVSQDYERLSSQQGNALQYQQLRQQLTDMTGALERNPYVIILIDGDGMVFDDVYLKKGLEGGRHAAAALYDAINAYIELETNTIPLGSRIMCRVYANMKGLADVLMRAGITNEAVQFEEFTRGFTAGKKLFDFVDVGPGKDRADTKIIEHLRLFIDDLQCRRVFLGCSHDNGFARALEDWTLDETKVAKVTLLEGIPFEKELLALPYRTKKFQGVFRETKINLGFLARSSPVAPAVSWSSPMPSPLTAGATTPTTPSPMNWAARVAASAPSTPVEAPKPKLEQREQGITRNRAGQRIDPECLSYNKTEVDRVKRIKLCNVHFLKKECPFGNACTHVHNYKPSTAELETLRLVARMAPCIYGTACAEAKCIYGHRCPAPRSKQDRPKGTKSCIFGEGCKFPAHLHDIDTKVVKTLVVR